MTQDQKTQIVFLIQDESKMDSPSIELILSFMDLFYTLSTKHKTAILGYLIYLLPESERVSLIKELLPHLSQDSIDCISEYMITLF